MGALALRPPASLQTLVIGEVAAPRYSPFLLSRLQLPLDRQSHGVWAPSRSAAANRWSVRSGRLATTGPSGLGFWTLLGVEKTT